MGEKREGAGARSSEAARPRGAERNEASESEQGRGEPTTARVPLGFYLGTHKPQWLATAAFPLFVSHRRLRERRSLPRAREPWALDSGGFSELFLFGRWTIAPADYAAAVRRYADEIGRLEWAAAQDWMCEPFIIAKSGLSVAEHQRRTVENFAELKALAPDLPWMPVLQGWKPADYLRHLEAYDAAGFDLRSAPRVGIGSVCRRQDTDEAESLIRELARLGLRLHGFGFKVRGLLRVARDLASSDSMAWSYQARRNDPLPGCTHAKCSNCFAFAEAWRARLIARVEREPVQLRLPL